MKLLIFRSESKRKREEDLLSDDDFEKELEGLSDNESDIDDDINEDDLMMELEEMIGSWYISTMFL